MISWIKTHKLAVFLALVIVFLLGNSRIQTYQSEYFDATVKSKAPGILSPTLIRSFYPAYPAPSTTPRPDITNRKVITDSYVSLVVKNVRETAAQIKTEVAAAKGYIVTSNISSPEAGEDATLTIRVPSEKLEEVLTKFRGMAVKVVSENVSGTDITDQYVDIQARIDRLDKTKAVFEGMLDKTANVDQILRIQQEIFSVQDQIDAYKGQLAYMDGASSTSLITVYLSTDELALPYASVKSWRPELAFKQAVRSLLGTLQVAGSFAIWLGVYLVILVPAAIIGWIVYKNLKKKLQH